MHIILMKLLFCCLKQVRRGFWLDKMRHGSWLDGSEGATLGLLIFHRKTTDIALFIVDFTSLI